MEEAEEDRKRPPSIFDRPVAPGKTSAHGFVQRELTCQSVCWDQLSEDSDQLREKAAKGRGGRHQRPKEDTTEFFFESQNVDGKLKNFRSRAEHTCSMEVAAAAEAGTHKRSVHILDLPSEILVEIFSLLPTYQIMHSIANVCKRFRIISEDSSLQPLEYERKILKLLQAGQHDRQKDMAASLKRWPRNQKTAAAEDGKLTEDSVAAAKPKTVISGARESSALTPSTQILQRHEKLCLGSSNNDEKGYLATKKRGINPVCQNVSNNDELIGLDC